MEQTFDTPERVSAYVELGAGDLVVRAEQTDQTVVSVTGPRAEEFTVELEGRHLAVLAPRSRFLGGREEHRVELVVPLSSDLVTRTGSADTETVGELGMLKLKTGSGDITVDETTGPAIVESGSGDVRCVRTGAELRVKSGSGDVEIGEAAGNVGVSTGSGDVLVEVAHQATVVKTGNGDLEIRRAEHDVSGSTASGDVQISHAGNGRIVAKTASGDVRVGVPRGTPVWTDINTVSGRIGSNLESTGKPAEGQPYLEVRATSVSGDIVLTQL